MLDTYAEGVYDGVRLVAALAERGQPAAGAARVRPTAPGAAASGAGSRTPVHLARADGLEFDVGRA